MKIGIFGAEEQEVKLLKKHLVGEIRKIAGLNFFTGTIMGKDVVLVCSGIGKVNAALCCQILISEFKVDAVINTGAAGGLIEDLKVFDIVVSSEAVQHDVDATAFGYPLGQVPMTKSPFWPADKKLKNLAVKAFKTMQQEHDDEHIKNLKLVEGLIASGDVFVSDEKIRARIIKEFNPACVEMEGAAAAQVCKINKIPFLILRSISDTAGRDEAAKISYDVFFGTGSKGFLSSGAANAEDALKTMKVMDSFEFTTVQGKTEVFYCDEPSLPPVGISGGMYIADSNTASIARAAKNFRSDLPLVIIEAGEEHKNFTSLVLILKTALDAGLSRNSVFIGAGGGLVCDLAAFAASVYMRGAKCKLVPTSLLAMADAAIGGKTAINFDGYKNMVGTFFKADEVYISPKVLKSLSEEEYLSGLSEIFKMGLLYSNDIYQAFRTQKEKILARDEDLCLELVKQAVEAKAQVVSRDFDEKNERAFLNLGHTFGHALESVLNFSQVSHGEAVAWGISRALLVGKKLGLTDPAYTDEVIDLIKVYGLPDESVLPDPDEIILAMKKDKKNINGKIRLILQKNICETFTCEVSEDIIREVL